MTGRPPSTVRAVALLWGLQAAFLSPALALLLVSLFGASTGQVAVILAMYQSAALFSSWAMPRWADRHKEYVRPMLLCAALTVSLSVAWSFAHSLTLGVLALVLLGAPAASGSPLLFGFLRHSGASPSAMVSTRALFSVAWVAGPPVAATVIAWSGGSALVLCLAGVGVANIGAISVLHRVRRAGRSAAEGAREAARTPRANLAPRSAVTLLVLAVAAVQATNSAAVAITALFVTQTLHLSALWGGIALGVAAGLEVPVLLVLGRWTHRVKDLPVLSVACLLGTTYYLGMAAAPNGPVVIGLQMFNAVFYAVISGVALTLFQAVIAGPGAAAGLLSNAQRIGGLLSGPIVGLGAVGLWNLGLRTVFVACAVITLLALLFVRLAFRRIPVAPGVPDAAGSA